MRSARQPRPFSWPLALGLLGLGVLAAALPHVSRSDFDRAGVS